MDNWTDVATVAELPPGSRRVVDVDGTLVAVFNLAGAYHAIEDTCPHDRGELASGTLEGEEIVCPRHGARFSVISGRSASPLAYQALQVMEVRVADGMIQVRDPRWA
ncbi:MAG: non-heme iron oxygenase ferredoxin subunit [Sulfuricella sp.]|nr:non-heme iron oxygenase ferredoxin subunit [Sulfuricella sp.]